MNLDEFGAVMRSEPFRPFIMHLADGREVTVRHPEMAAFAATSRVVTVYQPDGQLHLIDLFLVTDIEFRESIAS
jgi:hypothetical protein